MCSWMWARPRPPLRRAESELRGHHQLDGDVLRGINTNTINAANFTLTRNGTNSFTPSLTWVSSRVLQLGNLAAVTALLATYTLNYDPANAGPGWQSSTNGATLTGRITTNVPPLLTFITNRVITRTTVRISKSKPLIRTAMNSPTR